MKIGVVGSEGIKFTPRTESICRALIRDLLEYHEPITVVSGECHLGGVDLFAKEEALRMGHKFVGFPPKNLQWSTGYKPRNIQIAEASDEVWCFTVAELPEGYTGMRFKLCYHCGTNEHVKSGGCWTVKYAKSIGKEGGIVVIR